MPANLETPAVATELEKVSFHSNPKERQCQRMFKLHTIALISHATKVMLKILQARLQQYVNRELPHVQAGLRKGRGTRDQIANICWIMEKAREFQKNIYFCFTDYAKAFACVDHNKLWKVLKVMGIPDYLTCLLRNLYAGVFHFCTEVGKFIVHKTVSCLVKHFKIFFYSFLPHYQGTAFPGIL